MKTYEKKFELSVPFSMHNGAVVMESSGNKIKFGIRNIKDLALRKKLEKAWKSYWISSCSSRESGQSGEILQPEFVELSKAQLEKMVLKNYGQSGEGELKGEGEGDSDEKKAAALLFDSLLEEGISRGATDIHIGEGSVHFRINGMLEKVSSLSKERSFELVRRIKVLARLDVMENRRGQDGQFVSVVDLGSCKKIPVCVRVSCVPSLSSAFSSGHGEAESVVLRLLDATRVPLDIDRLGFDKNQSESLRDACRLPHGLILVCGPTGSGKSTTAAALLNEIYGLSAGRKKIVTIEDPPEYVLSGATQICVDEKVGMTFEESLRRVFRQDPDVIFVGEIRDEKTACTAIHASFTGHLVIATVHTSGFYETFMRMKNLGVDFPELNLVLKRIVMQKLAVEKERPVLEAEVLDVCACGFDFEEGVSEKAFYKKARGKILSNYSLFNSFIKDVV